MQINLPADIEQYVAEKMSSGKYSSLDELLADSLRVMRRVEEVAPGARDDLRRELDKGLRDIEEGRVSEWNPEEVRQELLRGAKRRNAL